MTPLTLTGKNLSLGALEPLFPHRFSTLTLSPSPTALQRVRSSFDALTQRLTRKEILYGITTGFGDLSQVVIPEKEWVELQYNLVRSHASGTGPYLEAAPARLVLMVVLNSLLKGCSGVSPDLIHALTAFFNAGLAPAIPVQGSVGASGDLAPLAALALALIGEGTVIDSRENSPSTAFLQKASTALPRHRLKPYRLKPKEGLSLINGTHFSLALLIEQTLRAKGLVLWAEACAAASVEGLRASHIPFAPTVARLRPYAGVQTTCHNLHILLRHSAINRSHEHCGKIQDVYSVRCIPQVHGAVRETLSFVEKTLDTELQSVTDNPLILSSPPENQLLMAGNFHGHPLALAADALTIAMASLSGIAERRICTLLYPPFSGHLPPYLTSQAGTQSGLMMLQIVAASLVSENKTYAHPASVDSIPTSNGKEDYVSMAPFAARKLGWVLDNLEKILAMELICATQALELLKPLSPGQGVAWLYQEVRNRVRALTHDRPLTADVDRLVTTLLKNPAGQKNALRRRFPALHP